MSRLSFSEGNHSYWLRDDDGKKRRVPSVSSLKKTLHQFDGERWYINEAATAAADAWAELADLPATSRQARIVQLAQAAIAQPREFGTAVHDYVEQLWAGEPVQVGDTYAAHVTAAAEWFNTERVGIVHAEALAWAEAGDFGQSAMAGRVDMIVRHPAWGLGLLDLKTWQAGRSGQPRTAEWAFQLAAYSQMEFIVTDGDQPFPTISWCGVLHVGPSGADLYRLGAADWEAANEQVDAARVLKALTKPSMEKQA